MASKSFDGKPTNQSEGSVASLADTSAMENSSVVDELAAIWRLAGGDSDDVVKGSSAGDSPNDRSAEELKGKHTLKRQSRSDSESSVEDSHDRKRRSESPSEAQGPSVYEKSGSRKKVSDEHRTQQRPRSKERRESSERKRSPDSRSPDRRKKDYDRRRSPERVSSRRSPDGRRGSDRRRSPGRKGSPNRARSPDRRNSDRKRSPNRRRRSQEGRRRSRSRERKRSPYRGKRNADSKYDYSRRESRSRSRDRDRRSTHSPKRRKSERSDSRSPPPRGRYESGKGICRAVLPPIGKGKDSKEPLSTEQVEAKLNAHMQRVKTKAVEDAKNINLPSYLNPAMVNVQQFKAQQEKRKLLWSAKKKEEKTTGTASAVWGQQTFTDEAVDAKFKQLMGIKNKTSGESSEKVERSRKAMEELEREYEKSRVFQLSRGAGGVTGIGLGFGHNEHP